MFSVFQKVVSLLHPHAKAQSALNNDYIRDGGKLAVVLRDSLAKLEELGIDRLTIQVQETDEVLAGEWIESNQFLYYPDEYFCEQEKKLIEEQKNYQVISLIANPDGKYVKYPYQGVEIIDRYFVQNSQWLLPANDMDVYVRKDKFFAPDSIAQEWAEHGVDHFKLQELIDLKIQEFQSKDFDNSF